MRVKVRRTWWKVRDVDDLENFGECVYAERTVELRAEQRPKDRLDTLIHELLHALRPDFAEREIYAISRTLTEAIWKDSCRRTKTRRNGH